MYKRQIVQLQKWDLSRKQIVKLAEDVVAKYESYAKYEIVKKQWYKSFVARHNLTLRKPEN